MDKIDELRFIFTSPTFIEENLKKEVPKFFIPHLFKEADLCGGEFELRLKNQLNQRAIARECSKWVKEKVVFKSNKQLGSHLPGMIHLENTNNESIAYSNVGSFTTSDLGTTHKKGFPTLIQKTVSTISFKNFLLIHYPMTR